MSEEEKKDLALEISCIMGSLMGSSHKDQINQSAKLYQELTGKKLEGYPFGEKKKKKKWYQF